MAVVECAIQADYKLEARTATLAVALCLQVDQSWIAAVQMGIGISDDQLQDVLILAVAWHRVESREYKVEHGQ